MPWVNVPGVGSRGKDGNRRSTCVTSRTHERRLPRGCDVMRLLKWTWTLLVLLLGLMPPLQGVVKGQEPVPRSEKVTVQEGERVRVRILQEISSKTANVGDVFDGEAADDVEVGGKVAVAKGARVLGTITAVQRAAWLGRPGRLGFAFEHARAVDGTRVRLRATTERVGQGNEAAAWVLDC